MTSTTKNIPKSPELTREFGVEKFRRHSEQFIKNEIEGVKNDTDNEYYLSLNDQLYKLNLAYRMVKCLLEEHYPDSFEDLFSDMIEKTYSHFGSIDISQAPITGNSSEFTQNTERIKYGSDEILKLLLREANTHLSNELTKDMIGELFSEESASGICGESNNGRIEIDNSLIPQEQSGSLSKKRKIEDLDQECLEKFFQSEIDKGGKKSQEAYKQLNLLKLAYGLVKWKFQGTRRHSGERYFEHLREAAHIVIREGGNPNFDQVLIAMLHDVMEDTNVSFNTLKTLFGKKVAFSVHLISKKSPLHYVEKDEEQNINIKNQLKESGILNKNLNINDRLASKLKKIKSVLTSSSFFSKNDRKKLLDGGITKEEIFSLEGFNFLKITYNKKRKDDYFSHYRSKKQFKQYAQNEAKKLELKFTEEEIQKIVIDTMQVKLADRLHNLRTLIENTKGKIRETLENFKNICLEDNFLGAKVLRQVGKINMKFVQHLVHIK